MSVSLFQDDRKPDLAHADHFYARQKLLSLSRGNDGLDDTQGVELSVIRQDVRQLLSQGH